MNMGTGVKKFDPKKRTEKNPAMIRKNRQAQKIMHIANPKLERK